MDFYHKAIAARTQVEVEAAGKLFAQALLRGGLDVIDVLFAAGAYRRLLTLGGGVVSFRGVMAYLAERVRLLQARLASGSQGLKRLTQQTERWIENRKKGTLSPIPSAQQEAYKAAQEIVATSSKRQRPTAVSALVDKKTGKVYIGRSGRIKSANELDSRVRSRLPSESQLPEGQDWPTYNCAEVDALNQAVKDGADPKTQFSILSELAKTGDIKDFERCANCKITTKGIKTTSDPHH